MLNARSSGCARACATCARCWSRSIRRAWSPPGWRRRSTTCSARCARRACETTLEVEPGGRADALVYRVAREALRNVAEHADATPRARSP